MIFGMDHNIKCEKSGVISNKNKSIIAFCVLLLVINVTALLVMFTAIKPTVNYRVVTIDEDTCITDRNAFNIYDDIGSGEVRLCESCIELRRWVRVDAEMAASIAHVTVLGWHHSYRQPYLVYHDEENDIFIVLADVRGFEGIARVAICGKTGGVMVSHTITHTTMPNID